MKTKFFILIVVIHVQLLAFAQISFASEFTQQCKSEALKEPYYDYKIAESMCKAAILLEKDNTEAYFWHGVVLSQRGVVLALSAIGSLETKQSKELRMNMFHEAINDFSIVIDRFPTDIQALANRGIVYRELDDYPKALNDFSKALAVDDSYSMAYFGRASVYVQLGLLENAEKDYNKGIELEPTNITGYYNRGRFYKEIIKKPCLALSDYKRCHESNDSILFTRLFYFSQYASALNDCGNKKLALQYYKQIASHKRTGGGEDYFIEDAIDEIKKIDAFLKARPGNN